MKYEFSSILLALLTVMILSLSIFCTILYIVKRSALKKESKDGTINLSNLSLQKARLLMACYRAIRFIDDSKLIRKEIDINEESSVYERERIEIIHTSIGYVVKVNGVDVIDDNIKW